MATGDDIGRRGEAIFHTQLTELCGRNRPYFRAQYLGDKFPALDFFVELLDAGPRTPFFFVQVKSTRRGYTTGRGAARLKVRVSAREVRRMALYPAPTYVVGIDDRRRVGYILSIRSDMRGPIQTLPTDHLLTCANLGRLWEEVKNFWETCDMTMSKSVFTDEGNRYG